MGFCKRFKKDRTLDNLEYYSNKQNTIKLTKDEYEALKTLYNIEYLVENSIGASEKPSNGLLSSPRPSPSEGKERALESLSGPIRKLEGLKKELTTEVKEQVIEEQKRMFKFSNKSKEKLSSCQLDLQKLMEEALKVSDVDFGVSCGTRSKKDQDEAYRTGKSKVQWPNSAHNSSPSKAVDIYAYVPSEGGVTWKLKYYYYLAGVIFTVAKQLNIKVRWGGDFNKNGNYSDDPFLDAVHFELE